MPRTVGILAGFESAADRRRDRGATTGLRPAVASLLARGAFSTACAGAGASRRRRRRARAAFAGGRRVRSRRPQRRFDLAFDAHPRLPLRSKRPLPGGQEPSGVRYRLFTSQTQAKSRRRAVAGRRALGRHRTRRREFWRFSARLRRRSRRLTAMPGGILARRIECMASPRHRVRTLGSPARRSAPLARGPTIGSSRDDGCAGGDGRAPALHQPFPGGPCRRLCAQLDLQRKRPDRSFRRGAVVATFPRGFANPWISWFFNPRMNAAE